MPRMGSRNRPYVARPPTCAEPFGLAPQHDRRAAAIVGLGVDQRRLGRARVRWAHPPSVATPSVSAVVACTRRQPNTVPRLARIVLGLNKSRSRIGDDHRVDPRAVGAEAQQAAAPGFSSLGSPRPVEPAAARCSPTTGPAFRATGQHTAGSLAEAQFLEHFFGNRRGDRSGFRGRLRRPQLVAGG